MSREPFEPFAPENTYLPGCDVATFADPAHLERLIDEAEEVPCAAS